MYVAKLLNDIVFLYMQLDVARYDWFWTPNFSSPSGDLKW